MRRVIQGRDEVTRATAGANSRSESIWGGVGPPRDPGAAASGRLSSDHCRPALWSASPYSFGLQVDLAVLSASESYLHRHLEKGSGSADSMRQYPSLQTIVRT